jgi:hypothetical protein
VKITLESTTGGAYNAETEDWESFPALTVSWQEAKGTKRREVTFRFESSKPNEMLRAAAVYFEKGL